MIKCPYCHTMNEDGALFCETCKSDLTGVPSVGSVPPLPLTPAGPADQVVEAVPVAVYAEAVPLSGEQVIAEAVPYEAVPYEAVPVEPIPITADSVIEEAPNPAAAPVAPAPSVTTPPPASAASPPPPVAETPVDGAGAALPPGSQPRLLVLRGQRRNVEYPLYEGLNFLGRADEKPVDIDLEDQEPPDRIWCSRQHACIGFEDNILTIEDLNSANGTYVNRTRVYPGAKRPLALNDIIQIGNVQLKVVV